MTTHPIPPEDAFDQWLDALADDDQLPIDDERAGTAAFLHQHFGLPQTGEVDIPPNVHASMGALPTSQHALADTEPEEASNSTGAEPVIVIERTRPAWRVITLASAAVLTLIAIATIAAFLRLDDSNQHGVNATASMLPFSPSSALASPTPVAGCTTDDTLLLMPEEPIEPGAFANLPFSVAWYADGLLTVERSGEVIREIEIEGSMNLTRTAVGDVVLATKGGSESEGQHARFANIVTGEQFDIERYYRLVPTSGPFMFWASNKSYSRWHALDLRTFEATDLKEHFRVDPLGPWTPFTHPMMSSDDGTVLLLGTTRYDPANHDVASATPITSDGPELRINHSALLINGTLGDISIVGPLTPISGALALAPDGETMAWLAPSDQDGERILTIANTDSGDIISERSVEATYSNSLLFSEDGSALYATSGDTLEVIDLSDSASTPSSNTETATLPDTGLRIFAASPDRTKLLLTRHEHSASETAFWLDVRTGEVRALAGQPARMWESRFPGQIASPIVSHMLIDDYENSVELLEMASGETVMSIDRNDGGAAILISADASTIIAPHHDAITWLDLDTGTTTNIDRPDGSLQSLALASDGDCAVITWRLSNSTLETTPLTSQGQELVPLPSSLSSGWVVNAETG